MKTAEDGLSVQAHVALVADEEDEEDGKQGEGAERGEGSGVVATLYLILFFISC